MTKVWDGPTPYDSTKCRTPDELLSVLGMVEGYRAAMNSPEVVAMYEALDAMLGTASMRIRRVPTDEEVALAEKAFAAYKAGLKHDHQ